MPDTTDRVYSSAQEGSTNLSKGKMRQLSARERRYIRFRYGSPRMGQTEAYIEAAKRADGTSPFTSGISAKVGACRMDKRLRSNPALWADIMRAAEIDDYAIAGDLNDMRKATRVEIYQGELVKDDKGEVLELIDNPIRIRALELMTELLGHRKQEIQLTGQPVLTVLFRDATTPKPPADGEPKAP